MKPESNATTTNGSSERTASTLGEFRGPEMSLAEQRKSKTDYPVLAIRAIALGSFVAVRAIGGGEIGEVTGDQLVFN